MSSIQWLICPFFDCFSDTDLFDYSQNGAGPDNQPDQLVSTISDIPSISAVDATDNVR